MCESTPKDILQSLISNSRKERSLTAILFLKRMKKKIKARRTRLFFALCVVALGIGFLSAYVFREPLGWIVWRNFHSAPVATALNRTDPALFFDIGNYYFGGSAYDLGAAERAFRGAVSIDSRILLGHYQLARILFAKGDFPEALAEINNELNVNPQNLRSLYVRGLVEGYSGSFLKAAEDFSRFVAWSPTEWAGYNDLAWALSKVGEYEKALAAINTSFVKVPGGEKNPWLWNSKGVAELNLQKYEEATVSFATAKALAEQLTEADWQRAYPGNDPKSATDGRRIFRDAIEKNLLQARSRKTE